MAIDLLVSENFEMTCCNGKSHGKLPTVKLKKRKKKKVNDAV